jgi:hypothetical protein
MPVLRRYTPGLLGYAPNLMRVQSLSGSICLTDAVYQVRQRIFDDFLTAVLKQPSIPAYLLC